MRTAFCCSRLPDTPTSLLASGGCGSVTPVAASPATLAEGLSRTVRAEHLQPSSSNALELMRLVHVFEGTGDHGSRARGHNWPGVSDDARKDISVEADAESRQLSVTTAEPPRLHTDPRTGGRAVEYHGEADGGPGGRTDAPAPVRSASNLRIASMPPPLSRR